jgi:pimeloyl-ACP methyl ester carboxylesterase
MQRITSADGIRVSYERYGSGPPLVLVHGSFSDHITNWQESKSLLEETFTVYSIARRGRGESSITNDHSLEDEMNDVVAVLKAIGEPVFLLGHSYGAVCSLGAAVRAPENVARLVLYEHPDEGFASHELVASLQAFGAKEDWHGMVEFFMQALGVPQAEIEEIKTTPFWDVWIRDAAATLNDMRAIEHLRLDLDTYRSLTMPVGLMIGDESPRDNYATDKLSAVLPDSQILTLKGTAHEGMTMVPDQFVDKISEFLLSEPIVPVSRKAA